MKVPRLGDSISDATIIKFYKNIGDKIKADEPLAEVETDKVNVEIKAESDGVITNIFAKPNQKVDIGANLIEYDSDPKKAKMETPQKPPEKPKAEKPEKPKIAPPKPEKPKIAPPKPEKPKMEPPKPEKPKPEPPKAKDKAPSPPPKPKVPKPPLPIFMGGRNERREPMSRIRQRIAERLKQSQNIAATLTTFNEVDMSEIMQTRKKYQEEFTKKYGVNLGLMSVFLKASTMALTEMPILNAVIDGNDIIYRDYIDISVAVSTPTGLMVPVIRNCETKSFGDFEMILRNIGTEAKEGKIKLEDVTGGTFTISNGGVYGSMMSTPIINRPQSAILGMHNITNRAVVRGDQIVSRPMMYVALSYDHRLIDGRDGVSFLKRIRDLVQEPNRVLLDI